MGPALQSPIHCAAKAAVIEVNRNPGQAGAAVCAIGRDLMVMGIKGAAIETCTAESSATDIVTGAIDGSGEKGGDPWMTIQSIVRGTVTGARDIGIDPGTIAVHSTRAAVQAAEQIGIDAAKAIELAVNGAVWAADAMGADSARRVIHALTDSIYECEPCLSELNGSDSPKNRRRSGSTGQPASPPREGLFGAQM